MVVELAGAPPRGAVNRAWRLAPAAILVGLGVLAAALPRANPPAAWREGTESWRSAPPTEADALSRIEPSALAASGADGVHRAFRDNGYTLDAVRESGESVPRVLLPRLPADMTAVESPDQRKQIFIRMMLPLLLAENERILDDRNRLIDIRHRLETGAAIGQTGHERLAGLALRYGVDDGDVDELLRRVDAVPPSLAIAQAALETGWGTSRGAQRQRNMFGHMSFDGRDGAKVRPFADLAGAVEAYARNLNTHRAYAGFRDRRAKMRMAGDAPDGLELARALERYSERKLDYVRDVRGLIRANNLRPLDQARLID